MIDIKKINEIKNNIEKLEKDLAEQKRLVAKLEKGDYEIGDEEVLFGLDCIFIGYDKLNRPKFMTKNVIKTTTYSDNNSNDYCESNVKKYLEEEFVNKLDTSKLASMKTNYDEDKYSDSLVRIPTLREIESLPMNIRNCGQSYWTMTASYSVSEDCSSAYVFLVYSSGNLNYGYRVSNTYGVRPVITLKAETL